MRVLGTGAKRVGKSFTLQGTKIETFLLEKISK
jgi:hypothetical protein